MAKLKEKAEADTKGMGTNYQVKDAAHRCQKIKIDLDPVIL